jgi:small acid-soluble spore protein L (minor)
MIAKIVDDFYRFFIFFGGQVIIFTGGVKIMSSEKRGNNRGKKAHGVNPQGYGEDVEFSTEPKSKLENAAKKKNTK